MGLLVQPELIPAVREALSIADVTYEHVKYSHTSMSALGLHHQVSHYLESVAPMHLVVMPQSVFYGYV